MSQSLVVGIIERRDDSNSEVIMLIDGNGPSASGSVILKAFRNT